MAGEVTPPQISEPAKQGGFISRHPYAIGIGAVVIIGGGFFLYEHFHKKPAAAKTTQASSKKLAGEDVAANEQNELLSEQSEVNSLYDWIDHGQQGSAQKAPPTKTGSGYSQAGNGYVNISGPEITWLQKHKQPSYYEPAIGTFKEVIFKNGKPQGIDQGTPEFASEPETKLKGFPAKAAS